MIIITELFIINFMKSKRGDFLKPIGHNSFNLDDYE